MKKTFPLMLTECLTSPQSFSICAKRWRIVVQPQILRSQVMPDTSAAKILIVDDEAPQMEALCNTLRDEGYATTGFASGHEALALLRERHFDLLLTDLMMPGMD